MDPELKKKLSIVPDLEQEEVTIWVDGCFDVMHFGHANAIRRAKMLFKNKKVKLICGVHTDKEIERFKGPCVMKEEERYAAVRQCKWVDECIEAVPYVTSLEMIKKYNVDYVIHGDDITYDEHGNNSYQEIMDADKFLIVKRTRGVSTTDIVNRILTAVEYKKQQNGNAKDITESFHSPKQQEFSKTPALPVYESTEIGYLPTATRIRDFSIPLRKKKDGDKVVYVDGGFDMFHVGHGEFLKECRKRGDYLIVGLHTDEVLKRHHGKGFPIMTLHERCLSVLSCRYVDDVIIGAPYVVTPELLDQYEIDVVCHGSVIEHTITVDPYTLPKQRNMFQEVPSPSSLTLTQIVNRIYQNSKRYQDRNKKKELKDASSTK
mmetsp:Transcript_7430/g.10981  ORF Transcript_7430/g.10981 Transcript_7430/m.10981 type:complete len:376 (+) Transcript_7430:47-1174(+)